MTVNVRCDSTQKEKTFEEIFLLNRHFVEKFVYCIQYLTINVNQYLYT